MATVVERSRISDRLPGRRRVRVSVRPSAAFTLKQTVPTGLSSVPPPGPAMPVIATAVSAPKRCSARGHGLGHRLRHRAVRLDQRRVDAEHLRFRLVRIGHHPAGHVVRRSGPIGQPRRQQSRGARLRRRDPVPGEKLRDQIVDTRAVFGVQLMPVPLAQQLRQLRVRVGGVRLVAGDHFDLPAPQAGGDLEPVESGHGLSASRSVSASPDSGRPNIRSISCR